MVLRNGSKLYGLIAVFAGVIAAPIGCMGDDFRSCKTTRTCPPKGGDAGEGGDGATGNDTGGARGGSTLTGGTSTGGTSTGGTSTGGTGGTAGTDGPDEGGNGGTPDGGDTERPTIESFAPDDGDVDVERDIAVTVTFSEPIDETSVTSTSVTLTGPDGDVDGVLSVKDDVVSFVPDKKLYLLGDYTLTIGEGVADLAGNTLGEEASVGFRVRDGRWGALITPFGVSTARSVSRVAHNTFGDLALAGTTGDADQRIWTAFYHAAENEWTLPQTIHGVSSYDVYPSSIGINDQRRAALAWGGNGLDGGGWFRFGEANGWVDVGAQASNSNLTITAQGQAVSAFQDGQNLMGQTLELATGTVGLPARISPIEIVYAVVPSVSRVAIITLLWPPGSVAHVSWYDPSAGWGEPAVLATSDEIGDIRAGSDKDGNIVVLWSQGNEIWSKTYLAAQRQWSQPGRLTTLGGDPWIGEPEVANGRAVVRFGIMDTPRLFGAYYSVDKGWVQDSIRELGTGDELGSMALAIDGLGNALYTWSDGNLSYRRYIPGIGWSSVLKHETELLVNFGGVAIDGTATMIGFYRPPNVGIGPAALQFE